MLGQDGGTADGDRVVTGKGGDGMGVLAPEQHGQAADQDASADGYDDHVDRGRLAQRP